MKFKIEDWAGNEIKKKLKSGIWVEMDFKTFDDGWNYIYSHFKEEYFGELYVVLKGV